MSVALVSMMLLILGCTSLMQARSCASLLIGKEMSEYIFLWFRISTMHSSSSKEVFASRVLIEVAATNQRAGSSSRVSTSRQFFLQIFCIVMYVASIPAPLQILWTSSFMFWRIALAFSEAFACACSKGHGVGISFRGATRNRSFPATNFSIL